jgi:MoxR-like ATPase
MVDFEKIIREAWNGNIVTLKKSEVKKSELESVKVKLLTEGIVIFEKDGEYEISRFNKNRKPVQQVGHTYEMPDFADEVDCLLSQAMRGKSHNILLTGPAGCGKSEFVREIAKRNGFGKVFQVNGRDDMDSSDFFGEKTVVVDPASKQNYIEFKKGPLYQAFIEGTEVDENGDQILYDDNGNRVYDESGNPKVVGKPAVFFLDEFAALIPSVFLSVFNRAMEIPRKNGASRVIEISADGGKIVKSHPHLVMFLAGNTVGKGTESDSQMGYTAQNNQMDDSTLDRITAFYKFGYNMDAEKNIASTKLNDDKLVSDLCRFRSEIRKQWVNGNVETLLSTRALVQICDLATSFRAMKKDFLPLAIYRSVFSGLRERECPAWNETIRMVFGVDVLSKYGNRSNNKKMFFVEKI